MEVKLRKRRQTRRAEFWRTCISFGRNGWARFGLSLHRLVCGDWGRSQDDRGRWPVEDRARGVIRGRGAEMEPLSANSRIRAAQVKGAVVLLRVGGHDGDGCSLTFPIVADFGDVSIPARTALPL